MQDLKGNVNSTAILYVILSNAQDKSHKLKLASLNHICQDLMPL